MSPRRRIDAGAAPALRIPASHPRHRLLSVAAPVAAVALIAALTLSAFVFVKAATAARANIRNAAVIDFVRSFITQYTSPDPFNANAYADKVLALGTGNFATLYSDRMNQVVIQVAQAEPGVGTVQEIGIERWNPDDSVSVIAVANMTTKMPDGKKVESPSRWEVTAVKEGDQWKVSDLIQVL
jgi:Mce-associated membrane protein